MSLFVTSLVQISRSSPLLNDISNALNFVTSLAPEVARMAPDVANFAPDLLQQVISTGGGTTGCFFTPQNTIILLKMFFHFHFRCSYRRSSDGDHRCDHAARPHHHHHRAHDGHHGPGYCYWHP